MLIKYTDYSASPPCAMHMKRGADRHVALTCTTRRCMSCTSCKLVAIRAMIVKQYWCHSCEGRSQWNVLDSHMSVIFTIVLWFCHLLMPLFSFLFSLMPFLLLITMTGTFLPAIKLIWLVPQYLIKDNCPWTTGKHCMIKSVCTVNYPY